MTDQINSTFAVSAAFLRGLPNGARVSVTLTMAEAHRARVLASTLNDGRRYSVRRDLAFSVEKDAAVRRYIISVERGEVSQ